MDRFNADTERAFDVLMCKDEQPASTLSQKVESLHDAVCYLRRTDDQLEERVAALEARTGINEAPDEQSPEPDPDREELKAELRDLVEQRVQLTEARCPITARIQAIAKELA